MRKAAATATPAQRPKPAYHKPVDRSTFPEHIKAEFNEALGPNMENGIKYIHPRIAKTPGHFDNQFRTL